MFKNFKFPLGEFFAAASGALTGAIAKTTVSSYEIFNSDSSRALAWEHVGLGATFLLGPAYVTYLASRWRPKTVTALAFVAGLSAYGLYDEASRSKCDPSLYNRLTTSPDVLENDRKGLFCGGGGFVLERPNFTAILPFLILNR